MVQEMGLAPMMELQNRVPDFSNRPFAHVSLVLQRSFKMAHLFYFWDVTYKELKNIVGFGMVEHRFIIANDNQHIPGQNRDGSPTAKWHYLHLGGCQLKILGFEPTARSAKVAGIHNRPSPISMVKNG